MTKCIVLGENKEERKGTPIELCQFLAYDYKWEKIYHDEYRANKFKNIELICMNYDENEAGKFDLMFGYNDNRTAGVLFIGHWNDGFVED